MLVGDAQHLEIDADTALREELADRRSESARDDVLFDRDKTRDARREREDALRIQRLRESRVHDGRIDSFAREDVGGLERGADWMAVRQDHEVASFAERFGHPDRHLGERRVERDALADAAREADAHGTASGGGVAIRRPEHLTHLPLVLGGHERHSWKDPEIRDVVQALVRASVVPDDPAAIHREDHG